MSNFLDNLVQRNLEGAPQALRPRTLSRFEGSALAVEPGPQEAEFKNPGPKLVPNQTESVRQMVAAESKSRMTGGLALRVSAANIGQVGRSALSPVTRVEQRVILSEREVVRIERDPATHAAEGASTNSKLNDAEPRTPRVIPAKVHQVDSIGRVPKNVPQVALEKRAPATAPTVRVTIGRIEVRPPASSPVAAPSAPSRPAESPVMTLEAYLSRRVGGVL